MDHLPHQYRQFLAQFREMMDCRIWLTGGWVTSRMLKIPYAGDIDLLVSSSWERLEHELSNAGYQIQKTFSGALRFELSDRNSVDCWASESFDQAINVRRHMASYNYTVFSAAIDTISGEMCSTNEFDHDVARGAVKFCTEYRRSQEHAVGNLVTSDILQRYFNFHVMDGGTAGMLAADKRLYDAANPCADSRQLLSAVSARILAGGILPECSTYLCRGIVRNAVLGCASYWDDYDVLVDASVGDCERYLADRRVSFVSNYFGMPKVRLADGQKVDIICMPGVQLTEALEAFPISVDRVAWDCHKGVAVDPHDAAYDIRNRQLEFHPDASVVSDDRTNYYALKMAYLAVKDGYCLSDAAHELVLRRRDLSEFDLSSGYRLARELVCRCSAEHLTSNVKRFAGAAGDSAAGVLMQYVDVGMYRGA